MRISDWSSDVCSSDLRATRPRSAPTTAPGTEDTRDEAQPRSPAVLLAAHEDPGLLPRSRALAGRHRLPGRDGVQQAPRTAHRRLDRARGGNRGLGQGGRAEIGRAPVWTPVTNAHLVCRLLL